MSSQRSITIFHSPDADDAFMFYGMVSGAVSYPGYEFKHELCDIQSLNKRALQGDLDVTAISIHTYPYVAQNYVMLRAGASMGGENYGPRLIANQHIDLADGKNRVIAIPGELTSAALALRIYLQEKNINADLVSAHFEKIHELVQKKEVDAGVIIHEGQITLEREGYQTVLDLGAWWWEENKLPLPLGINIVHRRLGEEGMRAAATILRDSIEYSLAHRREALDYALSYGRGLSREDADTFVGMYVNELTREIGSDGEKSIRMFLERGHRYGIIPKFCEPEFIAPASLCRD